VAPDEFRGVLCMLAPGKNKRLRCNVPHTLFVSVDGVPLSLFVVDAKGSVAHHAADKLMGAGGAGKTFSDFADACVAFAMEGRGLGGSPLCSSTCAVLSLKSRPTHHTESSA